MRKALALLVAIGGCGGIDVDYPLTDAQVAHDAAPDAAAPDAPADAAPADAPIDACVFGAWGTVHPLTELATSDDERDPWLSDDRLEILFTRGGRMYRATRAAVTDPFAAGEVIDTAIYGRQSAPSLSRDGLTLYFTAMPGYIFADVDMYYIYSASRLDRSSPFSGSHYIQVDGTHHNFTASVDQLHGVFDRANDLLATDRTMPSGFFGPAAAIAVPNTAGFECCAQLTDDGLVFTSDQLGATTVLYSARLPSGAYDTPREVAPQAAPPAGSRNLTSHLTGDGRTLVFASDRPGGAGGLDLYEIDRACN